MFICGLIASAAAPPVIIAAIAALPKTVPMVIVIIAFLIRRLGPFVCEHIDGVNALPFLLECFTSRKERIEAFKRELPFVIACVESVWMRTNHEQNRDLPKIDLQQLAEDSSIIDALFKQYSAYGENGVKAQIDEGKLRQVLGQEQVSQALQAGRTTEKDMSEALAELMESEQAEKCWHVNLEDISKLTEQAKMESPQTKQSQSYKEWYQEQKAKFKNYFSLNIHIPSIA
mmetsp:Transcript_154513/g.296631  ORF Transcript_154513/g.296631 Transcript_154513/m.296631 type:complete len:230 (-) Transcript_154513:8-697(-)